MNRFCQSQILFSFLIAKNQSFLSLGLFVGQTFTFQVKHLNFLKPHAAYKYYKNYFIDFPIIAQYWETRGNIQLKYYYGLSVYFFDRLKILCKFCCEIIFDTFP